MDKISAHAYVYVRTGHVCACARARVHKCACAQACVCVRTCAQARVCMCVCRGTCVCMCAGTCVRARVCTGAYVHVYVCTGACVRVRGPARAAWAPERARVLAGQAHTDSRRAGTALMSLVPRSVDRALTMHQISLEALSGEQFNPDSSRGSGDFDPTWYRCVHRGTETSNETPEVPEGPGTGTRTDACLLLLEAGLLFSFWFVFLTQTPPLRCSILPPGDLPQTHPAERSLVAKDASHGLLAESWDARAQDPDRREDQEFQRPRRLVKSLGGRRGRRAGRVGAHGLCGGSPRSCGVAGLTVPPRCLRPWPPPFPARSPELEAGQPWAASREAAAPVETWARVWDPLETSRPQALTAPPPGTYPALGAPFSMGKQQSLRRVNVIYDSWARLQDPFKQNPQRLL